MNDRLLLSVVEGTTDPVYVKDDRGRFLIANSALGKILGFPIEEIVGRTDSDFLDQDFASQVMEIDRQVRERGVTLTFEEKGIINGEARTFLSTKGPVRDEGGQIVGSFGISREVTLDRIASEAKGRLAAIVESCEDAIISKDLDGVVTSWNAGAERLFGYKSEEILGRPIELLIPPEHQDDEPAILDMIRRGERIENYEAVRVANDGRTIEVSLTISPIIDDRGRIIGASKIARDISERKRYEAALDEARLEAERANRVKDQFLAVLSHELRTPLTPVLATLSYVEEMLDLPPILRDEIVSMRKNVELESRLIDDLLDVTRIGQGKLTIYPEVVDVHRVLWQTLEICREDADRKVLEVAMAFRARESHVSGDPARLQQVFWNLLKNAIKFTTDEGRISIRTTNPEPGRIVVEVSDSGMGIEPEFLEMIFDPFEQAGQSAMHRSGGLGLGLMIARNLVDLHGGSLTAASLGRGQGSTFVVSLESIAPPIEQKPPARRPDPGRVAGTLKILLVEDNPDTLRAIARLLKLNGFQVEVASSVREAFAVASDPKFDLLISDIGLPDGSGLEIMRHFRKNLGMKGIALSGFGSDDDIIASREAGFDHHLVKPVRIGTLIDAIRKVAV
ncbi:PAS domain S-box protein [Tundrisphaera lichenicola]|uniref:PAS domain S-box protein n=1 Tax=Tundrisphaera lichenicola TaxID=2029860 RepID=UPI003EBC2505